jgi:group II intron reverse transcriptase/maturase
VFTNVVQCLDEELLWEAFQRLRTGKKKATGIDGRTAAEYAEGLLDNLHDLHERLRTGRYRATPIKRVWIPKDDGSQRPIGILILEDKIVQKAMAMVLEAVFEGDFYDVSCGFRPNLSPHHGLSAVRKQIYQSHVSYILDVDIRQFFDSLDRTVFFDLLHRRVKDGGVDRLLRKWFHAGIVDGTQVSYSDQGTPQGSVIGPSIANIYLHYVIDEWFVKDVRPRLKGRCFLVRFADDAVLGFEYEEDARRVRDVIFKRLNKYGLEAHAKKTRLVKFTRPKIHGGKDCTNGTFDFLGFTHYWAKSRKGYWVVKRQTIRTRLNRTICRYNDWCQYNRHLPIKEQWKALSTKLHGYYQYFGIRGNYDSLYWVYFTLKKVWRRWLSRRSQKGGIPWKQFDRIFAHFPLPKPRIVHTWV